MYEDLEYGHDLLFVFFEATSVWALRGRSWSSFCFFNFSLFRQNNTDLTDTSVKITPAPFSLQVLVLMIFLHYINLVQHNSQQVKHGKQGHISRMLWCSRSQFQKCSPFRPRHPWSLWRFPGRRPCLYDGPPCMNDKNGKPCEMRLRMRKESRLKPSVFFACQRILLYFQKGCV